MKRTTRSRKSDADDLQSGPEQAEPVSSRARKTRAAKDEITKAYKAAKVDMKKKTAAKQRKDEDEPPTGPRQAKLDAIEKAKEGAEKGKRPRSNTTVSAGPARNRRKGAAPEANDAEEPVSNAASKGKKAGGKGAKGKAAKKIVAQQDPDSDHSGSEEREEDVDEGMESAIEVDETFEGDDVGEDPNPTADATANGAKPKRKVNAAKLNAKLGGSEPADAITSAVHTPGARSKENKKVFSAVAADDDDDILAFDGELTDLDDVEDEESEGVASDADEVVDDDDDGGLQAPFSDLAVGDDVMSANESEPEAAKIKPARQPRKAGTAQTKTPAESAVKAKPRPKPVKRKSAVEVEAQQPPQVERQAQVAEDKDNTEEDDDGDYERKDGADDSELDEAEEEEDVNTDPEDWGYKLDGKGYKVDRGVVVKKAPAKATKTPKGAKKREAQAMKANLSAKEPRRKVQDTDSVQMIGQVQYQREKDEKEIEKAAKVAKTFIEQGVPEHWRGSELTLDEHGRSCSVTQQESPAVKKTLHRFMNDEIQKFMVNRRDYGGVFNEGDMGIKMTIDGLAASADAIGEQVVWHRLKNDPTYGPRLAPPGFGRRSQCRTDFLYVMREIIKDNPKLGLQWPAKNATEKEKQKIWDANARRVRKLKSKGAYLCDGEWRTTKAKDDRVVEFWYSDAKDKNSPFCCEIVTETIGRAVLSDGVRWIPDEDFELTLVAKAHGEENEPDTFKPAVLPELVAFVGAVADHALDELSTGKLKKKRFVADDVEVVYKQHLSAINKLYTPVVKNMVMQKIFELSKLSVEPKSTFDDVKPATAASMAAFLAAK